MMYTKSHTSLPLKSSEPIPIKAPSKNREYLYSEPELQSHNTNELYDLKLNIFDPNKSSPPNSWNNRLLDRLDTYSYTPY